MRKRKKKGSEEEEDECARLPTLKGSLWGASEDMEEEEIDFFSSFRRLRKGTLLQQYKGKFPPTEWTTPQIKVCVCAYVYVCDNPATPVSRATPTLRGEKKRSSKGGGMQALKTTWKHDTFVLQRNQAEPNTVCYGNNTHAYILYTPATAGCNQKNVCVSAGTVILTVLLCCVFSRSAVM